MHRTPRFPFTRNAIASLFAVSLAFGLSGCGSDDDGASASTSTETTINGTAIAAAVTGVLAVTDSDGNVVATGTVSNGAFSVDLPNDTLNRELTFTVVGTYTDEVSGDTVTLTASNPLALLMAANHFTAGQTGNAPVTPGSTVIQHMVREHSMTLAQAQTAFQNAFGYLPDMTAVPFDPSTTDSTAAGARPLVDQNAAFRAGMFSQLASDFGLTGDDIADMLGALADDLADGALDGTGDTGSPVMIGSSVNLQTLNGDNPLSARLLGAYGGFAGSSGNAAGLSAPSMGLPAMSYDQSGASKTVTTASGHTLRVTLETEANAPIMSGFWTSRVNHKVTLEDVTSGGADPVDITTHANLISISQHPFMHMLSGHNHTTPHSMMADTTQAASGIYNMDTYYVMASEMGMGEMAMPMGVWDYRIDIAEDLDGDGSADETTSVIFHPQVTMSMGGSVFFAKASNANDTWTNMMGMSMPREYRVWLHEAAVNPTGGHDLTVFVSTRNMGDMSMGMDGMSGMGHSMMTFPAVYTGQALNGPLNQMNMRPEVSLGDVTVEVTLDDGLEGSTWYPMSADGETGRYTLASLAGLDTNAQDTLTFRLTVDGNEMTTSAGANPQLVFTAPTL